VAPGCRPFATVEALCTAWAKALLEDWHFEPASAEANVDRDASELLRCAVDSTELESASQLHRLSLQVLRQCDAGSDYLASDYTDPALHSCRETIQDELTLVAFESQGKLWPLVLTEIYQEINGPHQALELKLERHDSDQLSYFLRRTLHDGHHEAERPNLRGDVHHVQLALTDRGPVLQSRQLIGEIFHGTTVDADCVERCTATQEECREQCIRVVTEEPEVRVEHVSPCELRFHEMTAPLPSADAPVLQPPTVTSARAEDLSVPLCCSPSCQAPPVCAADVWTKIEHVR